jgi:hypothetical protein
MPQGTTWLDLVTLGVAIGGVLIACLSLVLTVRRDRQLGRVGVGLAVETEGTELVLRIVNTERRTVTAEKAGLTLSKHRDSPDSFPWNRINHRMGTFVQLSDPPLPKTLDPGTPAYPLLAPLHRVRGAFFPDLPGWAWCEDSYGTLYWAPVPEPIRADIVATKRRKYGPTDEYGQPTIVEAEDNAELTPDQLA